MTRCDTWAGIDNPEDRCQNPAEYVQGVIRNCDHMETHLNHCQEHAEFWSPRPIYCTTCEAEAHFTEPVRLKVAH